MTKDLNQQLQLHTQRINSVPNFAAIRLGLLVSDPTF